MGLRRRPRAAASRGPWRGGRDRHRRHRAAASASRNRSRERVGSCARHGASEWGLGPRLPGRGAGARAARRGSPARDRAWCTSPRRRRRSAGPARPGERARSDARTERRRSAPTDQRLVGEPELRAQRGDESLEHGEPPGRSGPWSAAAAAAGGRSRDHTRAASPSRCATSRPSCSPQTASASSSASGR